MIIQRYLVKEIMLSFLATLSILLLIIVGSTFVRLLGDVSSGSLPVEALSKLVFIGSINGAIQLTPITLLISIMLAFGRLYSDHEITAMQASGIGEKQLYKGIFLFVIPLTLLISVMVLFAIPALENINQNIKNDIKQRPEAAGIPVGEFMHSKVNGQQLTLFVEDIDEENVVMKNVFLHLATKQKKSNSTTELPTKNKEIILTGKEALLYIDPEAGSRIFKFKDGSLYDINKNTEEFTIFKFSEHGLHVPALAINTSKKLNTHSFFDLMKNNNNESNAEIHWRLALIFSIPIMALLALPLSHTTPRQGRYGKIAIGILLYAVYANLIITGQSKIRDGDIPNWLGLWWAHAIFIALAFWLVRRQYSRAG